jgi:type II secretory pathway component PulK
MITLKRQRGASLITAVFLITALAALGALMTRLTIHGSVVTINELLSSRALHAAESGIDWAVYDIINNTATGDSGGSVPLDGGNVWFNTSVQTWTIDTGSANQKTYYLINSQGSAGGTIANPTVQRTLTLQFMP